MGKKSKLFKSGLSKNAIKKNINEQNKINKNIINEDINDNLNEEKMSYSSDEDEKINKEKKIRYEPIVSYNKMKFDKANETLGLDENDINNLLNHPIRNRRNVHNKTFTKREKKRSREYLQTRKKNTRCDTLPTEA